MSIEDAPAASDGLDEADVPVVDIDEGLRRLGPWWVERQFDPASPDVVLGDEVTRNRTHRNWTLVGTTGSHHRAAVDERGAVWTDPEGWALDWWVGADDRWHLPSRRGRVQQSLVESSPVVRTALRVPGGECVQRVWAVAPGDGVPPGGAVMVEVTNASPVPVALAFAVVPVGPFAAAPVHRIDLHGTTVVVDGGPVMVLSRQPSRYAVGTAGTSDAVRQVLDGSAVPVWPEGGVHCRDGRASAALILPLPHTASARVMLPLAARSTVRARSGLPLPGPIGRARRRRRPNASTSVAGMTVTSEDLRRVPGPERVVGGWQAHTRRAPRLEFPETRLDEAVDAARRHLLLHAADDDPVRWGDQEVSAATIAAALDDHGLHAESRRLLLGLADRQNLDGTFDTSVSGGPEHGRPGDWLLALEHHVWLSGDAEVAHGLMGHIAKAAHAASRGRGDRIDRSAPQPPGHSASQLEVASAAARLLDLADQPAAANEVRALASRAVASAVDRASQRQSDERLVRGGVWDESERTGLRPDRTARLLAHRVSAGDPRAFEQLRWLLEVGAPTWTWPTAVHPRTLSGVAGTGHDPTATAEFLRAVRRFAAVEAERSLDLLPVVDPAWFGQGIEVHSLPTRAGRLSFAVRWHGERPAVLWDLEPAVEERLRPTATVTLRFPGLDPTWSTGERRGEALLAAPSAPSGEHDGSFS